LFQPGLNPAVFITQDEESSGIIDAQQVLGEGWFLFVVQNHKASTDPELVEGGLSRDDSPDSDRNKCNPGDQLQSFFRHEASNRRAEQHGQQRGHNKGAGGSEEDNGRRDGFLGCVQQGRDLCFIAEFCQQD